MAESRSRMATVADYGHTHFYVLWPRLPWPHLLYCGPAYGVLLAMVYRCKRRLVVYRGFHVIRYEN